MAKKTESLVEAELDLGIRGLQARRRSSSASQSNGCCMDRAFLQNFVTSGADLARQQHVFLRSEFGKMHGMQHHRAPVTPVHVPEGGDENEEEEQRTKLVGRDSGKPESGGSQ